MINIFHLLQFKLGHEIMESQRSRNQFRLTIELQSFLFQNLVFRTYRTSRTRNQNSGQKWISKSIHKMDNQNLEIGKIKKYEGHSRNPIGDSIRFGHFIQSFEKLSPPMHQFFKLQSSMKQRTLILSSQTSWIVKGRLDCPDPIVSTHVLTLIFRCLILISFDALLSYLGLFTRSII